MEFDELGIAWEIDKDIRVKNMNVSGLNWTDYQWIDVTNEHFVIWIRTAGVPHFRNKYLTVYEDMQPGYYTIQILN